MKTIQLLSRETIDQIAAGEVVERPASVVKELVENAIDAGARTITVEIKDGGISLIRVTDDGEGIGKDQVRAAFCRHATSKIREVADLNRIQSLGFRGEALSSIAAVAQVEMMTKRDEELMGVHYCIEGGREVSFTEVGIPKGTTVLVKNLFFHTPARRKFLKTPSTEGGYVADLCERLSLSKPKVSIRFMANGQVKFHTSGNGDLQEIIYRIFGRSFHRELIPISASMEGFSLKGYLGKPTLNRSNRNYEHCFVNGRAIKSILLQKAIEEGYKPFLMQHKFPFVVLNLEFDPELVDVNVHPTKMDIRIADSPKFMEFLGKKIRQALEEKELILDMDQPKITKSARKEQKDQKDPLPEPFEQKRLDQFLAKEEELSCLTTEAKPCLVKKEGSQEGLEALVFSEDLVSLTADFSASSSQKEEEALVVKEDFFYASKAFSVPKKENQEKNENLGEEIHQPLWDGEKGERDLPDNRKPVQGNLFGDRILKEENRHRFVILGQVFDTYWLLRYEDQLLFVDQHSAHEKVKYERLFAEYQQGEVHSQILQPPMIFHLTQREQAVLEEYRAYFCKMGFDWEDFGSNSIAMRAMPLALYGKSEKAFFEEILDEIVDKGCRGTPEVIVEKLISMACKAAVKGNQKMSPLEMQVLIEQMMELNNPYHCPHGRPTIISMSKQELEKKFKRIV